jgi:hypothetical protein
VLEGNKNVTGRIMSSWVVMHLSMLTPRGGGSGKGGGFDIFTKKNVKCHSLGTKFLVKIPHPRDEIVFPKHSVSSALYTSGDREGYELILIIYHMLKMTRIPSAIKYYKFNELFKIT